MSTVTWRGDPPPGDDPSPEKVDVVSAPAASWDRDAEFSAFMVSASPALARTAWLLCGDVHRAEELVQRALMNTYLAWPKARQGDPLAYARRTLANLRIDTWRRHRREVITAPTDLPEPWTAGPAAQHADRDQLVRALATLTPRQRRIVVLRHLEGLSEREVADDLGVSLGTVKSTASRGLGKLRAALERATTGTTS